MKLLKDSAIYLCGELFAKTLPFLLLPYLTRKLGVAGFGELSYYQTILSLLALFFSFSQDGALARYYYFYGKHNLANLMLTGYSYIALLSCFGLIFAWSQNSLILAAVVCAAATQSILATQLTWRQCQKRALAYTAIQTTSGIFGSLLTILLLETTTNQPIAMRFAALVLANALVSMIAYLLVQKEKKTRLTWRRFMLSGSYIIAFGAPLLLHHASNFAKGQLDRVLIYQYYSPEELGIYSAALQVASVLSVLMLAINKAVVPHYYHALKSGKLNAKKARKYGLIAVFLSPIFATITYIFPESLFTWFLGVHYIGTHYYICLFLIAYGLTLPYFLLVNYLFYYGKNKLIGLISLSSTGIYLLVLLMVSSIGLAWIPFAMIAGNLAILPILYYFVREPKNVQAA